MMGVDLRLLPFSSPDADFSHDILKVERRRELWEPIAEIEKNRGRDVPDTFYSFSGAGEKYGLTTKTPYGDNLRYVTAEDLLTLRRHKAVKDNHRNRAVWAWLAQMPHDTKVALYWH
jgi:hypothetical protein